MQLSMYKPNPKQLSVLNLNTYSKIDKEKSRRNIDTIYHSFIILKSSSNYVSLECERYEWLMCLKRIKFCFFHRTINDV